MSSRRAMLKGRSKRWIALALLFAGTVIAWQSGLATLAYFWANMKGQSAAWQATGVWLPFYRVSIEARAIDGVTKNASGLTYSVRTGTLFSVLNSPPEVIELSTEGQLLRRMPIEGARDPEGITHVRDDIFIIADERDQQLFRVGIDAATERLDVQSVPRLGLSIDSGRNRGFEGASWDASHGRLFIASEKSPMRVLVITGLPGLLDGSEFNLQIEDWMASHSAARIMKDLSSLTYHEPTGNLLLLSDESALIVEFALDGRPVSMLPMWRGLHGLSRKVPQAEGMAIGPDGAIYVLSEPNLFYRFERDPKPDWAVSAAR